MLDETLDKLIATIDTLKKRIESLRSAPHLSEAQTRLSLIDPLLRALSWDTGDPALVQPEYDLSGYKVDYALFGVDGNPVAVVEAKRLGETLGSHVLQLVTYATLSGAPYACLTDGDRWELYTVFDPKPMNQKLTLDVSVKDLPAYRCALQFIRLWHPKLASGQLMEAGNPMLDSVPTQPSRPTPPIPPTPPPPPPPAQGWSSLAEYKHVANAKPTKLRLPGGEEISVTKWTSVLIELAKWLVLTGALVRPLGRGAVVDRQSSQNRRAWQSYRELPNGLFLATHGNAGTVIERCKGMLSELNVDPATVHVYVG